MIWGKRTCCLAYNRASLLSIRILSSSSSPSRSPSPYPFPSSPSPPLPPFSSAACVDSMGLHRVENASHSGPAVSLHLYSPPFKTCQTFDQRTGTARTVRMTFWSEYGRRTKSSDSGATSRQQRRTVSYRREESLALHLFSKLQLLAEPIPLKWLCLWCAI